MKDQYTLTLAQETAINDWFWDVLPKDPDHPDRRMTGCGTKTKYGLYQVILRIVKDTNKEAL